MQVANRILDDTEMERIRRYEESISTDKLKPSGNRSERRAAERQVKREAKRNRKQWARA